MAQFDDYLNSVDGVGIDVDGQYGNQCWDLWAHYAVNLIGATYWQTTTNAGGGCPAHPGYTCGIWYGFDRSGLGTWFTPHTGTPQPGDVAIWDYGTGTAPLSHVAVVVSDNGGSVYCMTQNPGVSHYANISKSGILGYLRPDNQSFFASNPAPTPLPAPSGNTYTVVPGDTLWGISESYYGTGTEWPRIYQANTGQIANPNLIFPGQILTIP